MEDSLQKMQESLLKLILIKQRLTLFNQRLSLLGQNINEARLILQELQKEQEENEIQTTTP